MSEDLKQKLIQFVEERYFAEYAEKIKVESDTDLFTTGYIDSLGFVALLMVIEEFTGLSIDELMLINREELNTISNIIDNADKANKVKDNNAVVFLVSGQAPEFDQSYEWFSMLYRSEKDIKDTFDECADIILKELGLNISEIVLGNLHEERTIARSLILLSIEYTLLHFWQSIGVKAESLMGEGVGEYVAACFSGVMNFADAVKFIDSSLDESSSLSKITLSSPRIPFISSCNGSWIEDEALSPTYWADVINNSTFFSSGLVKLLDEQGRIFIEIGFSGDITKKFKMNGASAGRAIVSTFSNISSKDKIYETLNESIAYLNSKDIKVNFVANK